jgi:hypothetical protein
MSQHFQLIINTKKIYKNLNRRNAGADLCATKLKTPFFQTKPCRSVTLDEIHAEHPVHQEQVLPMYSGMEKDKDVIAGEACGMGPCPPLQHQPPGGS